MDGGVIEGGGVQMIVGERGCREREGQEDTHGWMGRGGPPKKSSDDDCVCMGI